MSVFGNTWANLAEAVLHAVEQKEPSRWAACAAWWLAGQSILSAGEFWRETAAFMTAQLPEAEQAVIRAELKEDDLALVASTLTWPTVPENVTSVIAGWWPVAATDEAIKAKYTGLLVAAMNGRARDFGYDSITTAVTYRGDPDQTFAAEGEAFFAWRSAVWQYGLAQLASVESGNAPLPTASAFIAGMPVFSINAEE